MYHYRTPPRNLDKTATITIGSNTFVVEADNLEKICDLGRGAYGIVEKMRHKQTNTIMAVKRITATGQTQEQKRLLMDLDISMRASDCQYTVHFYGALFREGDVWICMEVMDTSIDKFYPIVFKNGRKMPEDILGKVCAACWERGACEWVELTRSFNCRSRSQLLMHLIISTLSYALFTEMSNRPTY